MKRFTSTRLFAIVCMIVMGFVQTWAQDNTTVTVKAPTITPGSCEYNGTIMPVITADEGCSIVYVKSTSKLYTTVEDIDKNLGVKTENFNKATITDIINKTGNRYISAYATKDVNGQTYKSTVTIRMRIQRQTSPCLQVLSNSIWLTQLRHKTSILLLKMTKEIPSAD